ncbi:MAG TPA: hypothetical protein ENN77_01945 [Candidatus Wirthbacteria bacterium]|nr:hypothetical protein [Candidatus Wirthbacteria bacterium]
MDTPIIPDITNITQIRKNATDFFRSAAKSKAPKWVSIDSAIQAVVLSPHAYEELVREAQKHSQDGIYVVSASDPDHKLISDFDQKDRDRPGKTWPDLKRELTNP